MKQNFHLKILSILFLLSVNVLSDSKENLLTISQNVYKETIFEGKPKRYNHWMYQNYMISQGLKELGTYLNKDEYIDYPVKLINTYIDNSKQEINSKRYDKHYQTPKELWHSGLIPLLVKSNFASPSKEKLLGLKYFEEFLDNTHRLSNGALARSKKDYKSLCLQIDDIYMLVPYWIEKSRAENTVKFINLAVKEVIAYYDLLWDDETELLHCLWIEKSQKNGAHFWGRGNGWFMMAITALLNDLPKDHYQRDHILKIYRTVIDGLLNYQNKNGLWHQVLNHPEIFSEISCSSMFTYSILKAINSGWLKGSKYRQAGLLGWKGLQTKVTKDFLLKDTCVPTDMSEDKDYFFLRPRVTHDQHSIGPYILAGTEWLRANGHNNEINYKWSPQTEFIEDELIIDQKWGLVGANKNNKFSIDNELYNGNKVFNFKAEAGSNRIELTECFATQSQLKSIKESNKEILSTLKNVYGLSSCGDYGDTISYKWYTKFPSNLTRESKGIIAQWHGRPDRTTVKMPEGKVQRYNFKDFSNLLKKIKFQSFNDIEGGVRGIDIETGKESRHLLDGPAGGPIAALSIDNGMLKLLVRSGADIISSNKKPKLKPSLKRRVVKLGNREGYFLFARGLDKIEINKWVKFNAEIQFSDYRDNENGILKSGYVKFWINDELVVDWKGNIGKNDFLGPYFKFGIYKPSINGLEIKHSGYERIILKKGKRERNTIHKYLN